MLGALYEKALSPKSLLTRGLSRRCWSVEHSVRIGVYWSKSSSPYPVVLLPTSYNYNVPFSHNICITNDRQTDLSLCHRHRHQYGRPKTVLNGNVERKFDASIVIVICCYYLYCLYDYKMMLSVADAVLTHREGWDDPGQESVEDRSYSGASHHRSDGHRRVSFNVVCLHSCQVFLKLTMLEWDGMSSYGISHFSIFFSELEFCKIKYLWRQGERMKSCHVDTFFHFYSWFCVILQIGTWSSEYVARSESERCDDKRSDNIYYLDRVKSFALNEFCVSGRDIK